MSQIENTFKNSLRNFQSSSSRNNGISLPLANGGSSNGGSGIFKNFRESASNTFSNVSNTVQGYIPIGNNTEEEEPPFYQLSRVEVNPHTKRDEGCGKEEKEYLYFVYD
jgi:hypothetical protein